MRCRACDCDLNDFESTRKLETTGEYVDLCDKCFSFVEEESLEYYDGEDDVLDVLDDDNE